MTTDPASSQARGAIRDIVGDKILTGIQMINISRLSTHPLPVVAGGLITVAGQGPKDSNGAGKSSFIAGISLLSGDEQWRWSSGARGAGKLLFNAEVAAQETSHGNADRGYIIGVFTAADATTPEALANSALTVWLRVNAKAPYVDLRWSNGLHIPVGTTEAERVSTVEKLWSQLPRRGGNQDLHANRLNDTLYGNHVRCVSFLSTSVRASNTPNLLAQPLNELAPERIFDAIAALTGLDRELEHERAQRSIEHRSRQAEKDAQSDLETWEKETAVVEEGIRRRQNARAQLEQARTLWHGRCATAVSTAYHHDEEWGQTIKTLAAEFDQRDEKLEGLGNQLRNLSDDTEFKDRCDAVNTAWGEAQNTDKEFERKILNLIDDIEKAAKKRSDLEEQARDADGRDLDRAVNEHQTARSELETALKSIGTLETAVTDATQALQRAESGNDIAATALQQLRGNDIPTAPLLDALTMDSEMRTDWEPRLVPYKEAVIVPHADVDSALALLADQPGTVIISADAAASSPDASMPSCSDTRFTLATFLTALASRADSRLTDSAAGVAVVGKFAEPITGRASRIAAARARLADITANLGKAQTRVTTARSGVELAERRVAGAKAHQQSEQLRDTITQWRQGHKKLEQQRSNFQTVYDEAQSAYKTMLGDQATRATTIDNLRRQRDDLQGLQSDNTSQRTKLGLQRQALNLARLLADFGDRDPETAEEYLAGLPDEDQKLWKLERWNDEAWTALRRVMQMCFPTATPDDEIPAEIRALRPDEHWSAPSHHDIAGVCGPLLRAVDNHLAVTEQQDAYEQQQITRQREERIGDLSAAQNALREESIAAQAIRSSLAKGIAAKLKEVAKHFNDLDEEYGGYGADLDFTEPEPPTEPDQPWTWAITPKWKRAEGQRLANYQLQGNTALIEEKAIKLVCAAAITGGTNRPLLLILDELGRNLGKQHRREAVALFERIGRDRNITVIGALQDEMERYAIDTSGLFIKLRRDSDSKAYNDPPAITGHDDNDTRVKLLTDWLSHGHLAAARPTETDNPR